MHHGLIQQIQELFLVFESHLQGAIPHGEALHIHQLRVTTKKLRSICGLLESLHTGLVAKEVLLPIRKVYKSGGRVRDLQVLLGIVREYEAQLEEKYADWEIFLGGQMALHKAEFRYRAGRLAPDTSQRIAGEMAAALRAVPQEAFGKLLHSWVDQMAAQIIALLDGPKTDEDLHTARARVKDILYVLQWVQSCGIDHPFLPRLEEIRLMGSQLGDWHDRVVLLENLHDFQEECTQLSLPCNPSTTYEHLQGQVIRDRDQWLEGREAALRALFGTQK